MSQGVTMLGCHCHVCVTGGSLEPGLERFLSAIQTQGKEIPSTCSGGGALKYPHLIFFQGLKEDVRIPFTQEHFVSEVITHTTHSHYVLGGSFHFLAPLGDSGAVFCDA